MTAGRHAHRRDPAIGVVVACAVVGGFGLVFAVGSVIAPTVAPSAVADPFPTATRTPGQVVVPSVGAANAWDGEISRADRSGVQSAAESSRPGQITADAVTTWAETSASAPQATRRPQNATSASVSVSEAPARVPGPSEPAQGESAGFSTPPAPTPTATPTASPTEAPTPATTTAAPTTPSPTPTAEPTPPEPTTEPTPTTTPEPTETEPGDVIGELVDDVIETEETP